MSGGRTLVLSPAPNANGDLHLGHIAGPFLAADVYTRYARATGRDVLFGTGVQDTSTFVVTTARRLGIPADELIARSTGDVARTLAALGVEVDGFTRPDERHTKLVLDFMDRLYTTGKLVRRTMPFPFLPRTGEFLVDGFVKGGCPHCLAEGCPGPCETCSHPILPGELVAPRSTQYPDDPVELRDATIYVLPVEEYRTRLRDYFAGQLPTMRPHLAQIIEEQLAAPMADFPVTHPISWGIPAPFPDAAGQVINPNAEAMTWSSYSAAVSAEARGALLRADDEMWFPDAATETVYFLGIDNTYPFAIAGVAMLMAHEGRYGLPQRFVTNEFYELDNEKFSTSRGHAVWGGELAAEIPRDLIRFHLAATSPEHQRTDFSRAALAKVTGTRLVEPWRRIAAEVDRWVDQGALPVSERSRAAAARIVARFASAYELPRFSLNRAAETVATQLARLADQSPDPSDAGDFCHEVDVVLRCAAPILVDLCAQHSATIPTTPDTSWITPVRLPKVAD